MTDDSISETGRTKFRLRFSKGAFIVYGIFSAIIGVVLIVGSEPFIRSYESSHLAQWGLLLSDFGVSSTEELITFFLVMGAFALVSALLSVCAYALYTKKKSKITICLTALSSGLVWFLMLLFTPSGMMFFVTVVAAVYSLGAVVVCIFISVPERQ